MPAVYLFRGLHFLFPYLVTSYPSNSLSIFSHVDDCTDTSASVSTRTFMECKEEEVSLIAGTLTLSEAHNPISAKNYGSNATIPIGSSTSGSTSKPVICTGRQRALKRMSRRENETIQVYYVECEYTCADR